MEKDIYHEIREIVARNEEAIRNKGLPRSLIKSFGDPFFYMLGLRDGRTVEFVSATLSEDRQWVHIAGDDEAALYGVGCCGGILVSGLEERFCRGLDIRVSDIMWCADAPNGS